MELTMAKPKIYADFQNADSQGRVRLNCHGTFEDLSRQQIELREGLDLLLYADDLDAHGQPDDLIADGVAVYSPDEHCWVATIDWTAIRHASDDPTGKANGTPRTQQRAICPPPNQPNRHNTSTTNKCSP